MSQPYPPYFYHESSDDYHWEPSCCKNQFPGSGWTMVWMRPLSRDQCEICQAMKQMQEAYAPAPAVNMS